MAQTELRVQDVGEQGLLKRLLPFCLPGMVGDDGAVMPVDADRSLVVTSDVLVDGVHFSDRTTPPHAVGWRAAAANLSDLAAMGATPVGMTVGLSLPGAVKVAWVEQLYQGMADCLGQSGTGIVGGDICRSTVITVAIAAFGQVHETQIIRRSTAQPGDAILVTGGHGAARAGLELLLNPEFGTWAEGDRDFLIRKHQYPIPRLDILPLLSRAGRGAGMDSSDGLADAILQICRASQVGAHLDRRQIPMPACFKSGLSEIQALNWALYGGEDFELVLCLPMAEARSLLSQLGEDAAIIGRITPASNTLASNTPASNVLLIDSWGIAADEVLTLDKGFQHFG